MTDRYPYRHHGPAVHGSKLADYLISEANMTEDLEQLRAENALLPCPFCGGSSLVVRETYKPLKKFEVFCRGNYTRACDAAMWGETRDRAICEWNTRAALSADPAPAPGVTVQEAAKVLLQSKEARDTAFDKMWIVATEQFSLEATNTGGARYSVTGDVINALWYEGICAIAGENGND